MPLVSDIAASNVFTSLISILLSDPAKLLTLLQSLGRYFQSKFENEALYEVLEHHVRLEIHDADGERASYHKRQKVRFLQNNVIAFQDQAWGDGEIFIDYKCSPGVPVDRYREGHRYRILISLRETKKRGEVEEFHIQRKIKHGFLQPIEELQTEIDHKTQAIAFTLIFPKTRWAKRVFVIEQNRAQTKPLNTECFQTLPDGRLQVQWSMSYPKRFEAYILRWEW